MKLASAALVLMALVSCGAPREATSIPGGASPESPVSSTPGVTDPGANMSGEPQRVKPRPGMADVRAIGWQKARHVGTRAVEVTYWSGVEPCYVLDHVEVDYRADEVAITLYEGHDPADADKACIEIAVLKVVKVQLTEPLGDREVVDGAA